MSKNGKIFIIWLLMIAFFLLPELPYLLENTGINEWFDYARITDMEYTAIVGDEPGGNGKITVKEKLTFDVHAASVNNTFWELWRDLCEKSVDGVDVKYKVKSVKQIMPDGSEIIYQESDKLYWDDYDYVSTNPNYGPGKWYHSEGPYDEYNAQYECVLFYVDGLYREKVVFEIEYEMYNAVLRYNDCSELYLSMFSGPDVAHLNSFKGQILIPNDKMPRSDFYQYSTYGTHNDDFGVTESKDLNPGYHTFAIDLSKDDLKFNQHNQYIEFDLLTFGVDKHIFSQNASENWYTNDDVLEEIIAEQDAYFAEQEALRMKKWKIFGACCILSVILLLLGEIEPIKMKKKCPNYSTRPSKNIYREVPCDLDPVFASAFVFCKNRHKTDESSVYSAILLNLARKGYVEIREGANRDIILVVKEASNKVQIDGGDYEVRDDREPLNISELYYLNMIKRHAVGNTSISMNTLQERIAVDADYTSSFANNIKTCAAHYGVGKGYLDGSDFLDTQKNMIKQSERSIAYAIIFAAVNIVTYFTPIDFAFGGFFLLSLVCLIRGIYLRLRAPGYIGLTSFGETEYEKWRGLYNFLKSDTLINERTVVELPLWEKYLVYATAFGISEKVIQAIKIRCPISELGDNGTSIVMQNYYRSNRIHVHSKSFRTSVHTGYTRARRSYYGGYSGGYSGSGSYRGYSGHGYGGGGRGGGGGGGGH